jgi:signal transduction histidine kinase
MIDLNQQIHDIRKPLNAISMQAELIKMLVEMQTDATQDKVVKASSTIIAQAKLCSEQLQALFESIEQQTDIEKRR